MAADKTIKALIKHMEDSIESFQKGVPGIQKGVLDSLVSQLKGLQTQDGKILNSVQNLKLINGIKNKLERLIISEGYKDNVKQYIDAFDTVASLQQQYFAEFNFKFKPTKTIPYIKEMAIDSTLNDLLGQGLQSNVVERLHSILQDNVTSGGSYVSLNDQLRSTIVGGDDTEGLLQRYSKTITTDAINQYSAQYHEALAMDLSLNWGRYVGSNLTTTREFCDRLTAKEWVHKSELPMIIEGVIDGHKCKLSKSTGLPLGMIPGTNADNFKIRRGGYNCGHQFFWVPDVTVPEDVRRRFIEPAEVANQPVNMKVLKNGGFGRLLTNESVQKRLAPHAPELSKAEKTAIFGYTDNEYYTLNRHLRGEGSKLVADYHDNYKALLSNALNNSKNKYQGWVFRGSDLSKKDLQKYYDGHKNNAPVTHDEFTSTSHTIGTEFKGSVKFSIYSKRGVAVENLSQHPYEKEVLLNTGTQFKVLSIREADGTTYIKMEEI